ncbi:MAG TPA: proton-conducting transporter membrane subunit [Methanoregulaceae archaeon]|nr:proton-conducting transporter membrane subunit [Methanoregulaceae archaeon]
MVPFLLSAALLVLVIGILAPLAAAGRDMRSVRILSLACTALSSLALAAASLIVLLDGDPVTIFLCQPTPAIGIVFSLDRLAAFFTLLIAGISGCVAVYSVEYFDHLSGNGRRNVLCGAMNLFILAMVLVVASATTVSFVFFWELMAASSFFLVMYEYANGETRRAGVFYFIMTQLSTLFVFLGIIALFAGTGSFAISPIILSSSPLILPAFLALFTGFSIKAGIIPFHKWLPYAHPASPSPISALMSGVMLKVAVYGLIRFLLDVFAPEFWWGVLILAAGTVSAVLGIIYALKEHDIKGMLACSSIENVGIIFIGIGLSVILNALNLPALATLSLLGALFHSLNHALFKSLLFLSSGSVVHATHTRDIEHMGGLARRMPYTSALFFIGAAAIAALPPLNGFVSELMIFVAMFSSIPLVDPFVKVLLFVTLALFALTSALSAACFVKAFGSVFLALPRSPESEDATEVSSLMIVGPAILAAGCIILGIFSFQIFSLAGFNLPLPDMFLVGVLLCGTTVLVYGFLYFTTPHAHRVSPTWGCGASAQKPGSEYTGFGFSEPIVTIFSSVYRTKKKNVRHFYDAKECLFSDGIAGIDLIKVFEEYLYIPIAKAACRTSAAIARFQNGCLDTYLLYVFVTVVAIIVFLGWSA